MFYLIWLICLNINRGIFNVNKWILSKYSESLRWLLMKKLQVKAFAKINLALDVLSKRADGYHEVKMVMQNINLCDLINISYKEGDDLLTCNLNTVPLDESNIAMKAWRLLQKAYRLPNGIQIHIEKTIPVAAGLAGGSTNAAAVLKGVNSLFCLGLTMDEMQNHGLKLGADVPFSVLGGTALAEGIGEKLTELPVCPLFYVLAVNPGFPVPTPIVYQNLQLEAIRSRPNINKILNAIQGGDSETVIANTGNVLEYSSFKLYPVLTELKAEIAACGLKAMMSGSGGTMLGLSADKEKIELAAVKLKQKWPLVYTVATTGQVGNIIMYI
jgi:4-diphosphocytidyl-2-C-methyl-D-erythritol kinase